MKKIITTALIVSGLFSNQLSSSVLNNINTQQCAVPNEIMLSILMNESSSKNLGYPYVIRINGDDNYKKSKVVLSNALQKKQINNLNEYVYDCKNFSTCVSVAEKLINNDIRNMDLGAFQTNYYYHPAELAYYFSLEGSFLLACKYNHELINQYGYSWETIARYHSGTPHLNAKYKRNLIANYKKILKKAEVKAETKRVNNDG